MHSAALPPPAGKPRHLRHLSTTACSVRPAVRRRHGWLLLCHRGLQDAGPEARRRRHHARGQRRRLPPDSDANSGSCCCKKKRRSTLGDDDQCAPGGEGFAKRYRLGAELGRGEFGVTRRCEHAATGEALTCKTTRRKRLRRAADAEDMQREVEIRRRMSALEGAGGAVVRLREANRALF